MNDRELMQQVLDALEEIRYADISAVQDKAIENLRSRLTIRTRLAQPEQLPYWEPCNPGCDPEFNGQRSTYCAKLCHNAREALAAQPEPEPVAWMYEFGTDNADAVNEIRWYKNVHLTKPSGMVRNVVPLYTAQPQREWQGLTDEDYEAMAEKYVTNCYFDTLKYARAIEAKLKEKNT